MPWCYKNGLISGIDGKFQPHIANQCSHFHTGEELVDRFPDGLQNGVRIHTCRTCQLEGYSCIEYYNALAYVDFQDIVPGEYYYEPVLWAVQWGITNGVTANSFASGKSRTRGQVVTFLYRV